MLSHRLCGHYAPLGRLRVRWILARRHYFREMTDTSDKLHFLDQLESTRNTEVEYRIPIFTSFPAIHVVLEKSLPTI